MHMLQANTAVDIDRPLFRAFPPVLSFRGYQIGSTVEATLCLRNEDQASQSALVQCSLNNISLARLDIFGAKQQQMSHVDLSFMGAQALHHPVQSVASA